MNRAVVFAGRIALVILPLAAGLAFVAQSASMRSAPAQTDRGEAQTAARVLVMEPQNYTPLLMASGTVTPARTWRVISRVSAEIAWMHPDLRAGHLIDMGTEILRMDTTDYELGLARAQAGIAGAQARLAELETRKTSLQANLAIASQGLALAETELARRQELQGRDAASQSAVDQTETTVLERRAQVQEIENALAMLPVQRRAQQAEQAIAEAQLAEARRNLDHTVISMPFDGRIASVGAEQGQFSGTGQELVLADDIARVEIAVPVSPDQMRGLIGEDIDITEAFTLSASDIDALPRSIGLTAEVQLNIASLQASWPARVDRLSFALDPQTRMASIVVSVDDPIRQAELNKRPPLISGMFVDVLITGPVQRDRYIVPREALERGTDGNWGLYVLDDEDRLRHRVVQTEGFAGNTAVISAGLESGEHVVVGALPIAIEGMKIVPLQDAGLAERMSAYAAGARP